MTLKQHNTMASRTVVLLDPEDNRSLRDRAAEENVSSSEILRRALRAYTSNAAKDDEASLRLLLGEMNDALDAALESSRMARKEISRNLDQIRQHQAAGSGVQSDRKTSKRKVA